MKKLNRVLLMNWLHFKKTLIDIDDINFLTGKNGVGKSTFIDALQVVLLGEQGTHVFNKAASDTSKRTLKSYIYGETREGKEFSSYVVCEFFDDIENRYFTIGLVCDCHSDGMFRDQYFTYNGQIPDHCFVENRYAMDISALRNYFKTKPQSFANFPDSHKKYRDDILARWNLHSEQVFQMLKRGVSFRPIRNVEQFITENICDVQNPPDIAAMQQNIRDYQRHEELARHQEAMVKDLESIAQSFSNMVRSGGQLEMHTFLELYSAKEMKAQSLLKLQVEQASAEEELQRLEKQIKELDEQLERQQQRQQEMVADLARDEPYQEHQRLERLISGLEEKCIAHSKKLEGATLELRQACVHLTRLCETIVQWPARTEMQSLQEMAHSLVALYTPFLYATPEVFLSADFGLLQMQTQNFISILRNGYYQTEILFNTLNGELKKQEQEIQSLRRNVKSHPPELLRLQSRLSAALSCPVPILADLLEIAPGQERWRSAIEGYISHQKRYLLVPPEHYQQGAEIFKQWRRENPNESFGLVDINKLREKERLNPVENALSHKLESQNDLARDYITYLLGRVICCESNQELRQHRTAITPGGMQYRGYVMRPIRQKVMDDVCIGQQSITLRLKQLEQEHAQLKLEVEAIAPIYQTLKVEIDKQPLITVRYVAQDVVENQSLYHQHQDDLQALEKAQEDLSHCDIFRAASLEKDIKTLEIEIKKNQETRDVNNRQHGAQRNVLESLQHSIPEAANQLQQSVEFLQGRFAAAFMENEGIPRYQVEVGRLNTHHQVNQNYSSRRAQTEKEYDKHIETLFAQRKMYNQNYHVSFSWNTLENTAFEEELIHLRDSQLPQYLEKIKDARASAVEQFQSQFLDKLRLGIQTVTTQVHNLNRTLKQGQFGADSYQFRIGRNPDYADYYDMIMAPERETGDVGLFAMEFQNKYGPLVEELFSRLATSDDTQLNAKQQSELQKNIERFTDFRTYLSFDLEVTDAYGKVQKLSQTLNTKSGGETQTPFYISMFAAFAQIYKISDATAFGNTMRLVIFDEAFNKMDSDRIIESVRLLRKLNLQAIICTPPDKIADIAPQADRTFLVCKDQRSMQILPYGKTRTKE